jgi:hypothetical protein
VNALGTVLNGLLSRSTTLSKSMVRQSSQKESFLTATLSRLVLSILLISSESNGLFSLQLCGTMLCCKELKLESAIRLALGEGADEFGARDALLPLLNN